MSYSTTSISVIPGDSVLAFASLNRMSLCDTGDVKICPYVTLVMLRFGMETLGSIPVEKEENMSGCRCTIMHGRIGV